MHDTVRDVVGDALHGRELGAGAAIRQMRSDNPQLQNQIMRGPSQ